ncbi:MAG: tetratricopeptide repeat protein [Cyanobacteria bacterium P01_H01_bin.74]
MSPYGTDTNIHKDTNIEKTGPQTSPETFSQLEEARENLGYVFFEGAVDSSAISATDNSPAGLAVIHCTGNDATDFLQNRLTNDVSALKEHTGQLNAAVDRYGKIQSVFALFALNPDFNAASLTQSHNQTGQTGQTDQAQKADGKSFCILVNKTEKNACIEGILKYRITEAVEIEPLDDVCTLMILGNQSKAFLDAKFTSSMPAKKMAENDFDALPGLLAGVPVILIQAGYVQEPVYLILLNKAQKANLQAGLKAQENQENSVALRADDCERFRIEAGIPLFGIDYTHNTMLPETGLHHHAVSYTKGCYLGQETLAKVKTYGTLQKALMGVCFQAETDSHRAQLSQLAMLSSQSRLPAIKLINQTSSKKIGQLTSLTYSTARKAFIGFAYLIKSMRTPNQSLSVILEAGDFETNEQEQLSTSLPVNLPINLVVEALPFYKATTLENQVERLLQAGLTAFADGYDASAIETLQQVIDIEPTHLEAREALGVILGRNARYEEAIAQMKQILDNDPDYAMAHTNLSVFYMKIGNIEAAEEEKAKATMVSFRKHAKQSGLIADAEKQREQAALEKEKKKKAAEEKIVLFIEALKHSPDDALGNFGLASAYIELEQYSNAIDPLKKVIAAQPRHSVAHLSLGKAFEALGNADEATVIYQKGITVAADKGDLMPLKEMENRLAALQK